jgi:hypothetical protein
MKFRCFPKSLVDFRQLLASAGEKFVAVRGPAKRGFTLGNGSHQNVWMMILRYFK